MEATLSEVLHENALFLVICLVLIVLVVQEVNYLEAKNKAAADVGDTNDRKEKER